MDTTTTTAPAPTSQDSGGVVINMTQTIATTAAVGIGLALVTKFALKKSIGWAVGAGFIGLAAGWFVDAAVQAKINNK